MKKKKSYIGSLNKTKKGIVMTHHMRCIEQSEHISYTLMNKTNSKIKTLGMKDFSPGVQVKLDNMTPTAEKIANFAYKLVKN